MENTRIYGAAPKDLGLVSLSPNEMMFWLYLPIKLPGRSAEVLPANLRQFGGLLDVVANDVIENNSGMWTDSYVYLSVKTMFVGPSNPANRPGWHSDGFMTNDLNYIWYDSNGTEFWEPAELVSFTQDHKIGLKEMENPTGRINVYPDKHLLRLDQTVIHRVAPVLTAGVRSFVKVSISKDKYDLVGNSVNHELAPDWTYHTRAADRNAPATLEAKVSPNLSTVASVAA